MHPSHKKWAIFGAFLVLIAAGSLFLLRLRPKDTATAPAAKSSAVQDNQDHELKELGVQLQKKPGHFPVLMRMAQIERDQGKLADAEAHLRQAAASEPARADVHLELGRLLYEKGNRDEALKETQQALTLDPKDVDAMYNLGAIYANAGSPERARSYWENAIALNPESESGKKAHEGLAKLNGAR